MTSHEHFDQRDDDQPGRTGHGDPQHGGTGQEWAGAGVVVPVQRRAALADAAADTASGPGAGGFDSRGVSGADTPQDVTDPPAVTDRTADTDTGPDTAADTDTGPDTVADTGSGTGADVGPVLVGRVVSTGAGSADGSSDAVALLGEPPERVTWAWAVGWRNKARRLWVYRYRYLWNLAAVMSVWAARCSWWWLRGVGRAGRDFANYVDDRQGLDVASQAAGGLDGRADVDAWLKARAERHREVVDRRRVIRSRLALPVAVLVVVLLLVVWLGYSHAARTAAGPLLVLVWAGSGCWLVWYGRTKSAPFWPQMREPSPYPPVTNDTVTGALLATGIGYLRELVRAGQSPVDLIYRDDTAGGKIAETRVVPGVTTEMLTAKAIVIAGGLKRPPAMVHVSQAPSGVPGHVEILVMDIDPGTTKPARFAYLSDVAKGRGVKVGAPCTIGYDARNRPVRWVLPGTNGITTGTPGSGKTAYLVQLACLAAADTEGAILGLFDFKGMGDYAELEPVCYAYGAEPDPTDTARLLLAALLGLKREVVRRRRVLSELKREGSDLLDNGAAALTDRLARTRRYRMPWVLFIIDEVHEALSDPVHGKDIEEALRDLMKIGRACGLHIEIATQRTDADSVPTGISTLPVVRVAFHQNGQPGNDQILGTGAYKRGIDATAFRRGAQGSGADDRGSCWFIGSEGGLPVKVRTTFVLPDVKRIITAAHTSREAAGTLTGAAAGLSEQPAPTPAHCALDDVRAVFTGNEIALHGDVIFHRVNTRHPGRWKSWTALQAALKAEAPNWKSPTVDVGQVRPTDAPTDPGIERTRKGIRREHLTDAITRRTTTPPATSTTTGTNTTRPTVTESHRDGGPGAGHDPDARTD